MQFYIFSDDNLLKEELLSGLSKSKSRSSDSITLEVFDYKDLKKVIKKSEKKTVVYIDISGQDYLKDFKYLIKLDHIFPAFLDPKGEIKDPGILFLNGAVDYLAKTEIRSNLNLKRFKTVESYLQDYRLDFDEYSGEEETHELDVEKEEFLRVSGWEEIKDQHEYTFTFMYIELDDKDDMEKMYDKSNLKDALMIFRNYVERQITPFNGRIWIWNGFGGVVLFPYTGTPCESITAMFKLSLYKFIHDVEESSFPNLLSFRIAMHIGNLIYRKRQTGTIISDNINSLFHLGKRFTQPGHITLTEELVKRAPKELKEYFVPLDKYEGRDIYRMRRPIFLV